MSKIRKDFLDFFAANDHKIIKSSSLVPENDPTLLFTNSGMVQFKDVFTGKQSLPFKKVTTAQKSLRAGGKHNDLENVGYTARHHTFFEMLGNFSFGGYFKEEAISFAWNFITKNLELPKEKLLVTVHSTDEEAAVYWKKIAGLSDDKIIRIPTNDNFWMMGDTGPCGCCSEIFYDHGDKIQGGPPGSPDENGDRFIEVWNLVFMQFETLSDGSRINLEKPCVDTGMGIERITAIMQGVHNNYDIDTFKNIINDIKNLTGQCDPKYRYHNNVIADHIRAICFMIADGITPSNEGRGYVLRRIIRRALRHGYTMGMMEPFLFKLVKSVKNVMGDHYQELVHFENPTTEVLKSEEESFMKTIDKGMNILKDELSKIGSSNVFPADVAYKLYDTYGFPFDLTQDILKAENKKFDEDELEQISNAKKEESRKGWSGTGDTFTEKAWYDIKEKLSTSADIEFVRDTHSVENANTLAVINNPDNQHTYIITNKTPFFAESGGQAGDSGVITQGPDNVAEVVNTKIIIGLHVHECIIKKGEIKINQNTKLDINVQNRLECSRNHTCTHMLQKALQTILGSHVSQKGSNVSHERLRFDFIHNGTIDQSQISEIEHIVNENIDKSLDVTTSIVSLDEAMKSGAMALFGEKYPEKVRIVSIGGDFSKELCGGEHVKNTQQIKMFKILSVSSIGSGIKRIEGITGNYIRDHLEHEIQKLNEKISCQQTTIKNLEKKMCDVGVTKSLNFNEEKIGDVAFLRSDLTDADHKTILGIVDKQKECSDNKKIVLIANKNTKNNNISVCLFATCGINAVDVMKNASEKAGITIKCGGRCDLAQSGGITGDELEKLVDNIKNELKK